jgi:CRP/FNR family transcriptional regulator, cyclic AMP receptor protein
MASRDRVELLNVELELARHLAPEERAELAAVTLPVIELDQGPLELDVLLRTHNAFAAGVLSGMAVHALQIGEQSGIQLLGPGDLLIRGGAVCPPWLDRIDFRLVGPARLVLLGDEFLALARRAPRVTSALYECVSEQLQRVTGQLVICQLPRVDQRVLALLWLLAESWGQVTPGGVRLPLTLTHETVGAMIGARRPTVTLALRKLSEEGSIVHQDSGWLLLQPPPEPAATPKVLGPDVAGVSLSPWALPPAPAQDPSIVYADMAETVRQLREQHLHHRQQTRDQLRRVRTTRVRMNASRQRINQDTLRRRLPPSS